MKQKAVDRFVRELKPICHCDQQVRRLTALIRGSFAVLGIAAMSLAVMAPPALGGPGDGTVMGSTKILDNGPNSLRYNIVVVAEGFTSAQQANFNNYAQAVADLLLNTPDLEPYTPGINVLRLNVASTHAGADDPLECGGSGSLVNTYFDATFCAGGLRRALVVDAGLCAATLDAWVPEWDQAIVLVNSTIYGGTGGYISVASVGPGWSAVVIHELGHSAFGLGDEYEYWAGCGIDTDANYHPSYEPGVPNTTIQTNRALVKWRDLISQSTPVPTTVNADCTDCDIQGNPFPPSTVGLYEGADYYHCDCYRPQFNCRMRNGNYGFCAVCLQAAAATLTPYLPTHVDVRLASASPDSGVAITVAPADTSGLTSGVTPFVRTFNRFTSVSLTAPAIAGGNSFAKWKRDGMDFPGGPGIVVEAERNRTMTAVYLSCTTTVEQPNIDQPNPLCIGTSYCVFWRRLPGASSYDIRENGGVWESTLGDSTKCYSHLTEGTYTYEVRALSDCGVGAPSAPVSITLQSVPAPATPSQPTLIPAGPMCLGGMYTVRWNPVPDASWYEIRENGGPWLGTGAATQWSFVHSTTGTYAAEVRAANICATSQPSTASVMTIAPCRDLFVFSDNPYSGVPITISPVDQNLQGSDLTPFARLYCTGVMISLQAPATYNGNPFWKWLRDGVEYSTNPSISLSFDTTRIMTAVYFMPSLTVEVSGSPRDLLIGVTPADAYGELDGYSPFVRTYVGGTVVTLTAPSSSYGNPFLRWRRNGIDYSTNPIVTLSMDSAYTMQALYRLMARIEVESKSATAGSSLVPIHIKLTNDAPVRSITLPLELRSVTPGAFITRLRVTYAERLATYLTGTNVASQYASADGNCKTWLTNGYRTLTSAIPPGAEVAVGASPEGILLVRGRTTGPPLPAGADAVGSIVLSVNVTGNGSFEVDTTCVNPGNHPLFTLDDAPAFTGVLPAFTKGTITVSCSCPSQGDMILFGEINIFDVIYVINVVFSGRPDMQDPQCSTGRSDVNADGISDVFDVIYLIATSFENGPAPADPCGP